MLRQFVTCFRDVATHIIAMSRTLHSSSQHFLCGSELIVDHKTQTNAFWKLNNRCWRCYRFFTTTSSLHNVLSELWTQRNVAGCKTLNNDHYVYTCTYYQRQLFVFFSFMTDYLNFRLALAISFQGNVHTWLEETFNELNSSDMIRFETLS